MYRHCGGTYVHNLKNGVAFGAALPETENHMHGPDEFAVVDELTMSAKIFAPGDCGSLLLRDDRWESMKKERSRKFVFRDRDKNMSEKTFAELLERHIRENGYTK